MIHSLHNTLIQHKYLHCEIKEYQTYRSGYITSNE